jgi:hypothetical protein
MTFIPYPCPKPLEEMKSTKNGFYCNDCGHTLIDLRSENATLPSKGSCVISCEEEVEDEKTAEINTSYRFALALFIVMGSSMILNNSAYSQEFITSINEIKENSLKVDSSTIYIKGKITDTEGKPLKHLAIKITLANGSIIELDFPENFPLNHKNYSFIIPIHQLNKTIKIEYTYYGEIIIKEFLITQPEVELPTIEFERNKRDRYSKRKYPIVKGKIKI